MKRAQGRRRGRASWWPVTGHHFLLAAMGCGLGFTGALLALTSGALPLGQRVLDFLGALALGIVSLRFLARCIQEFTRRSDLRRRTRN
ncbi:hypothetical protein SSPIM334S_03663 [Streptomyces spiroverticillatus]|uniref:hypothetical protein n=1 Tax=Streptomyces finlayi TaxID=67296 RepID=UPI001677D819|nr:hypothetical protein [Streptomyces finlayi]